jgi:phenylalanyl-tRNA synthetase beta subunit
LLAGLQEALEKNRHNKELLGLKEIKLFEIGTVWKDGKEQVLVGTISETENGKEVPLELDMATAYEPLPFSDATRFRPFSKYPYIVRDIAVWVPTSTAPEGVLEMIQKEAGDLLVHSELFDRFIKQERVSLAFRLVFQSFERTLTEVEINKLMEKISGELRDKGFEIR